MYYFFWGALPLKSSQVWFFANITLLPAHQMTKFCIYSKRPPAICSKKRLQPQSIEISGCCSSVFCIFSYWAVLPLVSDQEGYFVNVNLFKTPPKISKKMITTTKLISMGEGGAPSPVKTKISIGEGCSPPSKRGQRNLPPRL